MLHVQVGDQGPFLSMETGTPLLTNDPNHIPFTQISNERPISSPATLPPVVECRDAASPASRPTQLASCDISTSPAAADHVSCTAVAPISPIFPQGKASGSAATPITGSLPMPLSSEERRNLEAKAKKRQSPKQKAEARAARAALDADDGLIQKLKLASATVDAHPSDIGETDNGTRLSAEGAGLISDTSGDKVKPTEEIVIVQVSPKSKTHDLKAKDAVDLLDIGASMSASPQQGEFPTSSPNLEPKLKRALPIDTTLNDPTPATPATKNLPPQPSSPDMSIPLPIRSSLLDANTRNDVEAGVFGGDIRICTTDQEIIIAHSLILGRASTLFQGPEALHKRFLPIPLNYTSRALRTLLDLLYPTDQRPPIASTSELIEILGLIRELQISSFWIREMLNDLIKQEPHPLRSWALATAFEYPDAQRSAIERYFRSDLVSSDHVPEELHLLDAYQIVRLNTSKERAIKAARDAILRVDMKCTSCHGEISPPNATPTPTPPNKVSLKTSRPNTASIGGLKLNKNSPIPSAVPQIPAETKEWYEGPIDMERPGWSMEYIIRTTNMNPFHESTTSDVIFESCYSLHTCGQQHQHAGLTSFSSKRARAARAKLHDRLDAIISQELQALSSSKPSSPQPPSHPQS
ncbi:hypothetical protein DL93DRAFT_2234589 [Clavulina sp. PMI_390]|nr:hypothetical protein DL93DRAFT_2234589 [Clavulina sp. PMI_390]